MNCPHCNTELRKGMKFCTSCGKELPLEIFCPQCGKALTKDMKFCNRCGASIEGNTPQHKEEQCVNTSGVDNLVCPICGEVLTTETTQCPNCHRNLFYKCNSCANDITYGEIIKSKGCCPNCGIRLRSLYNIPSEKYLYYEESATVSNLNSEKINEEKNTYSPLVLNSLIIILLGYSILSSIGLLIGIYEPSFAFWPFISAIISFILACVNKGLGYSIFGGKITEHILGFTFGCSLFFGVYTQFFTTPTHPTGNPQKDAEIMYKMYKKGLDDDHFLDECVKVYFEKYGGVGADDKLIELEEAMQPYLDKISRGE